MRWIIVCTLINVLLTLFNIFLVPVIMEVRNDLLVKALEKDITRILQDKGIF